MALVRLQSFDIMRRLAGSLDVAGVKQGAHSALLLPGPYLNNRPFTPLPPLPTA